MPTVPPRRPALRRPLAAAFLVLFVVSGRTALADTFHVATTGDDATGDGSAAKPWATVGRALSSSGVPQAGGHTVLVTDGVYEGVTTLSRGFDAPVVVRAEHAYKVKLTNADGGAEAIRVWVNAPARITFSGFVITNEHPSYGCPNGRETYYLVHIQDASEVTLSDNVIHGNNAPGTCNELVKINRSVDTAYPRDILIQGNVFYDRPNTGGTDLIDAVRPGEVTIVDNVFFDRPEHTASQSFITLKRQAPAVASTKSPRFRVARNVFLSWGGASDQAFVQLGEDGYPEVMINDAIIENNLFLGDSPATMAAPVQLKGAADVRVRANTTVGDLPSGSFGFRIGTEDQNPAVSGYFLRNNVFSDPTGTMTSRLVNAYGLVSDIELRHNLYWNAGNPLPTTGSPMPADDAGRIEADPGLPPGPLPVVLPRWDEASGAFPSGGATIRVEHRRLVETYAAIAATSPAAGAADPSDMPVDDIRGLARDAKPDLGAYEAGATGGGGGGGQAGGAGTGGGPGSGGGGGQGTGGFGGDGSGCEVLGGNAPGSAAWLTVVALGALVSRRGRRRQWARR
jgi:hypothetical protein